MTTLTPTITTSTRDDLARWFRDWGFVVGAEVGVWAGQFSKRLCDANPRLRLLCVDPWQASPDYVDPKCEPRKLERAYLDAKQRLARYPCTLIRKPSITAAAEVPDRSLDFVYIDGNHGRDHIAADLRAWAPKVRKGGVVAGHDYELTEPRSPWIQVREAVDEFVETHGIPDLTILSGDRSPSFFWRVL